MIDEQFLAAVEELIRTGGYDCLDCGQNTSAIGEYYMAADEVWLAAHPTRHGMLCIGCLERRLGRMLTAADFIECPVNDYYDWRQRFSRRLFDRLTQR